jgi:hypothetical protein
VIEYRFGLNKALAKILEDLDNIEKLFGFLEMEVQLSSSGDPKLQNDMKYLIGRTLEVDTFGGAPAKQFGNFKGTQYGFFVGLVAGLWNSQKQEGKRAIDSIITFNYDLVLERELEILKIRPLYWCGPNALDGDAFHSEPFHDAKIELNLLKLHGSINWGICRKCNRLHFLPYNQYLVKNLAENICSQCREAISSSLIVPPTWNKGTEEEFIRYVWKAALKELIEAGRIFIVGYSFPETDQFFKYMLGLALAHNDNLSEVYVVNPDQQVWERFQRLFHPYFLRRTVNQFSSYTDNFINSIPSLTKQNPNLG